MNEITINDLEMLSEYTFIEDKSNLKNDFRIGVLRFKENSEWKEKLVRVKSRKTTLEGRNFF